jgi:uncharacterized protein YecE (DUF72 family)
MKKNLRIGTSGYSYDDWRGPFYPDDLPKADMLTFYCQYFETVELNATYYTIPHQKTFQRLNEKTPENFEFIIKTHQETTHRRKENIPSLEKLLESVRPLQEYGKLHGFLAQFPYAFKNNESNRRYLLETRKGLGDIPLFVEFRNDSWMASQLPAFLEQNNIGYVNVDEPPLKGLLPVQDITSTNTGYIRLHGRNKKDWWDGRGSARYHYSYTPEQLNEWLINISRIIKKTYKTYIFFNNHPVGNAVKNAQQMIKILEQVKSD